MWRDDVVVDVVIRVEMCETRAQVCVYEWASLRSSSVVAMVEIRTSRCAGGWEHRRRHCQTMMMVANSLEDVCGQMPRPAPGVVVKRSYTYRGYRLGR